MTTKRKRNVPRPAETYRGAIRNLARGERNKRGTDKREARKGGHGWVLARLGRRKRWIREDFWPKYKMAFPKASILERLF